MASTPDQNPDSIPIDTDEDVEHVASSSTPGEHGVENSPGTFGGTAGTGTGDADSLVQDQEFER